MSPVHCGACKKEKDMAKTNIKKNMLWLAAGSEDSEGTDDRTQETSSKWAGL